MILKVKSTQALEIEAMIVVMKRGATPEQVQHMVRRVEDFGLRAHVIVGTERTVIAAIGEKREETKQSLESGPGVAEVVPILAPYKVASLEVKPEPTVMPARDLVVGNGHVGVIAGPCSVENERQIVSTARAVKAGRATALRGGAFKPRTSPYSFQGLKEDGLKLLAAARDETGLAVVTEVIAIRRRGAGRLLCRRAADRRPQHAELSAAGSGRRNRQTGAAEARAQRHHR